MDDLVATKSEPEVLAIVAYGPHHDEVFEPVYANDGEALLWVGDRIYTPDRSRYVTAPRDGDYSVFEIMALLVAG